jgi:hypothetical protein
MRIFLTSNDEELDVFPDYVSGFNYTFSMGTFDQIKSAFSESISLPCTDRNLTLLGLSKTNPAKVGKKAVYLKDKSGDIKLEGFMYVKGLSVNVVGETIGILILDKFSDFLEQIKNTKFYELLADDEFNHKFQLPRDTDSFDGINILDDYTEFVRYGYTDYNGFGKTQVAALHRWNEEFADGDGIQHIQPHFNVNQIFQRTFTKFGFDYVSKFIDETTETEWETDKLYVQFPMRYHGFDLGLRDVELLSNSAMWSNGVGLAHVCGIPESSGGGFPSPYTNSARQNFKDRNKIRVNSSVNVNDGEFNIFVQTTSVNQAEQDDGFIYPQDMVVARSGTYKFQFESTLPRLNLTLLGISQNVSICWQNLIESFTGNLELSLGITINGGYPIKMPLRNLIPSDFTAMGSQTIGAYTGYKYFRTTSVSIDATMEDDIELKMGDRVSFFLILDSKDAKFNIISHYANPQYKANKLFEELCNYDSWNAENRGNLHFFFNDSDVTGDMLDLGVGVYSQFLYSSIFNVFPITISCFPSKEYPLMGIPEVSTIGGNLSLETVDLKDNVKAFADYTIYEVLTDIMRRFNMTAFYDGINDRIFLDNFAEEYIVGYGAADAVQKYLDNDKEYQINLDAERVRTVEMKNNKGGSIKDTVLTDKTFGDLIEYIVDEEGTADYSFNFMFGINNGQVFGEFVYNDLDDNQMVATSFIPSRENVPVKDIGLRIGWLSSDTERTCGVLTPSPTQVFQPTGANVFEYPLYILVVRNGFKLPHFIQYNQLPDLAKTRHHLEFAYKEGNELLPESTIPAIVTCYEAWHKYYVENYLNNVEISVPMKLSINEAYDLLPIKKVSFGYGDCVIMDIGTFDLSEDESVVMCKFKKIS